MSAFGFDGAELGRIERVFRRDGTFIVTANDRRLSFPTALVGLVGEGFAVLRGTARELCDIGSPAPSPQSATGSTDTFPSLPKHPDSFQSSAICLLAV